MGKGKRNKNRNKANSLPRTTINLESGSSLSHSGNHQNDVTPTDDKSGAQRDSMPTNEDVVMSENDNGKGAGNAENGVAYCNKGLVQLLEETPVASCQLISRSLMLLEHTLLNDADPQVRKRALEAYSELVKREAEISLHEERSKRPGNFGNTAGSGQNYPSQSPHSFPLSV